jgi:hypothetical protein
MSQILNRESFPVVAMYFPHLETAIEVTGDAVCAKRRTTGVDAMFGVHMATSPFECPEQITAF